MTDRTVTNDLVGAVDELKGSGWGKGEGIVVGAEVRYTFFLRCFGGVDFNHSMGGRKRERRPPENAGC